MSGRFALFRWSAQLAGLPGFPGDLAPHWNLAPGAQVLLLREEQGQRRVDLARWGLTPAWLTDLSKTPAHARSESLASQPMFREAFRCRRGLLPANGFFEWRGVRRRPYWLGSEQGLLFMAALWEAYPVGERIYLSVAMVTREQAGQRRPLLLDEAGCVAWLDGQSTPDTLQSLLQACGPVLRERALSNLVNNPALDAPECLTSA